MNRMKKMLMIFSSVIVMSVFATPIASAASCGAGGGSSFLQLIPTWHEYLQKDPNNNCEISNFDFPGDIWKVALAAVDILLRVAGIVAVIFVIKAGFSYVLSRGNPQEAAKARQSIIDALIGVGITSISTILVAFLGRSLTG
ncbi:hypothetical protein KC930_01115 [Candidatus Saccharibacteria bacterium]|nr:hypothetical protein [Candidatus Saccharibacteria bacterium]